MAEVVLEDAVLLSLAHRPEVRRQFPELAPLLAAAVRARSCCRRDANIVAIFQGVKQAMSHLSDARKSSLKAALGASALRIYLRGPSGVRTVIL